MELLNLSYFEKATRAQRGSRIGATFAGRVPKRVLLRPKGGGSGKAPPYFLPETLKANFGLAVALCLVGTAGQVDHSLPG